MEGGEERTVSELIGVIGCAASPTKLTGFSSLSSGHTFFRSANNGPLCAAVLRDARERARYGAAQYARLLQRRFAPEPDGYTASRIVFCRDMQLLVLHLRNWQPARIP